MDYADLQQRLSAAVERYDSQTFLGSYRETARSSLLNAGLSTRANSLWKMAQYVVAKKDAGSPDGASSGYLTGWRTLASNYNNQTLLLEVGNGVWEAYDAQGNKLGDEQYIKDILEKMYLQKQVMQPVKMILTNYQLISYGAPGTGKSHGVDETAKTLPKEDVVRTTFHPDSDYSTFVGAYKPTMKRVARTLMKGEEIAKVTKGDSSLFCEQKISYSFVPQAFAKAYVQAWKRMTESGSDAVKPVLLVIEEINRGNCAQIFGDLFQLLDRGEDGYSTYPIISDSDFGDWIAEQFASMTLSDADVKSGRILKLPPNLYIWATMNTSDQSLFPIDSAFKRRWDWKYVPIREGKYKDGPKQGQKLGWKIKFTVPAHQEGGQSIAAKDYSYDWWEFLKNINAKIFKTTESEDKKLGYFFVKPDGVDATSNDGTISADRFVGKVIFYLWNDVFKDYGIETIFKADDAKKSEDEAKGVEFQAFFNEESDKVDANTLLKFFRHIDLKSDEEIAAAKAAQQQQASTAANPQGQNATP